MSESLSLPTTSAIRRQRRKRDTTVLRFMVEDLPVFEKQDFHNARLQSVINDKITAPGVSCIELSCKHALSVEALLSSYFR